MKRLFSERHGKAVPRVAEQLNDTTRSALLNLVASRVDQEWFGLTFPLGCGDGYVYAGTDRGRLRKTMDGFRVIWPEGDVADGKHTDDEVFDLIEFSYELIAQPRDPDFHSYMSHTHYSYDQEHGRELFALDVNRIFERNGMAFELVNGEVRRTPPAFLHEALREAKFATGDDALDQLLEDAREKFLNRSLAVRRESLEKLWDAWERLKTIEVGKDKKQRGETLLLRAAKDPAFRSELEAEARALTAIGNKFMIRHTEVGKIPVSQSTEVDYFFHRMFAMIRLLLRATDRGG